MPKHSLDDSGFLRNSMKVAGITGPIMIRPIEVRKFVVAGETP